MTLRRLYQWIVPIFPHKLKIQSSTQITPKRIPSFCFVNHFRTPLTKRYSNYDTCGAYFEIYHEDGTVELKLPVCPHKKQKLYAKDAEIPFIDDPEACGTWEFLDIVPTREHFVYGKPKCWHSVWLQKLYFIDGGQPYWVFPGWTKGKVYTLTGDRDNLIEHPDTIETIDGRKLMFLEIQMNENDATELWVYEQTNSRHIASKEEI